MLLKKFFKEQKKEPKFKMDEKVAPDAAGREIKVMFTVKGIIKFKGDWWYVLTARDNLNSAKNFVSRYSDYTEKTITIMAWNEENLISEKEAIKRKRDYFCGECYECDKEFEELKGEK